MGGTGAEADGTEQNLVEDSSLSSPLPVLYMTVFVHFGRHTVKVFRATHTHPKMCSENFLRGEAWEVRACEGFKAFVTAEGDVIGPCCWSVRIRGLNLRWKEESISRPDLFGYWYSFF